MLLLIQHFQPLNFLLFSEEIDGGCLEMWRVGCVMGSEIAVVEGVKLYAIFGIIACG